MSNPLLVFWAQLFSRREQLSRVRTHAHIESSTQASSTIFLVMRRMRAPLIILIVIFSVSVVGLTLIPGIDREGRPARISLFESFYFMSYTATTIGFGELPWPFTPAQRLWVTFSIYLSVVGWAYAIGSLLTLVQDRSFRQALALRRFTRRVAGLREPFFLVVGYGRAGELLAKAFDALGQQLVVVDESSDRVDALDLAAYHADIPGLVADASNPQHLKAAGLDHPFCAGVLALTNDDETNLAVTMTAALLRPDLPVVSRTVSAPIAERMLAFGTPTVVNPFDRFGEHLRLALNAPASYQLLTWLEAGPGAVLPERGRPPTDGRWVMCGYGRFGQEVTADLRAAGLQVTIIEPTERADPEPGVIVGDASDAGVLAQADLVGAVGLVAGTDNDTTNLSMLATARRLNPRLFLAARQNRPTSAGLFDALGVDALLVPTEVVAHEVYAQLSTPMLWRFIREMPVRGDQWAAELIQQLRHNCGRELPALWKLKLDSEQAPALEGWLADGRVSLDELLRSPEDRNRQLKVVPLLLLRGAEAMLTPDGDTVLAPDDELLFAGHGTERRELESTMVIDSTAMYVLFDQHVPASWVWRKLSRTSATSGRQEDRRRSPKTRTPS
ncbi:MAG: Potassium channel protein [uncultured Friedmanniella sp.]|uniref:Potassium channel protein n=1 Tax=uncultured Friedmanniella sp. TaxID=335381 RepID=A0A6J4KIL5_9ACTN|nr:NAD-binding protein [uncultured Friedmanniella sp.]CAA9304619.1 MAG: Potassium channel protein [uncultured Friedmanniella sp.]